MDSVSVGGHGVSKRNSRVSCMVYSLGVIFWTPRTHFGWSNLFSKKKFIKTFSSSSLQNIYTKVPKVSKNIGNTRVRFGHRIFFNGARFEALQTFAATRDDVLHAIDTLHSRTRTRSRSQ